MYSYYYLAAACSPKSRSFREGKGERRSKQASKQKKKLPRSEHDEKFNFFSLLSLSLPARCKIVIHLQLLAFLFFPIYDDTTVEEWGSLETDKGGGVHV